MIRVVRLAIEIGLVIDPSSIWLLIYFLLVLPSTLMDSLRILRQCGMNYDALQRLLVRCTTA